jgi:hypothetical protein
MFFYVIKYTLTSHASSSMLKELFYKKLYRYKKK